MFEHEAVACCSPGWFFVSRGFECKHSYFTPAILVDITICLLITPVTYRSNKIIFSHTCPLVAEDCKWWLRISSWQWVECQHYYNNRGCKIKFTKMYQSVMWRADKQQYIYRSNTLPKHRLLIFWGYNVVFICMFTGRAISAVQLTCFAHKVW
jgi:hypothetical protein